jgi:hypothetical protein
MRPPGESSRHFQVDFDGAIEMDNASRHTLEERLPAAATRLIEERSGELDQLVERLTPIA